MSYYEKEKQRYLNNIIEILNTADLWVLDQIFRFSVNMTKPDGEHKETTKQERTEEHRCNIIRMLYDLDNADVLNYVRIIIEDIVKERGIEV